MTGALPAAARDLAEAMTELGQPWMIIGGIAVIAHGVPRATIDVDATVLATGTTPASLLSALARHGFAPRIPDAERFALDHQVALVTHEISGVPVDVTLAWMPFEEEALGRVEWREFPGATLPVIGLDDLIVYKLVAARRRELDDVERLTVRRPVAVGLPTVPPAPWPSARRTSRAAGYRNPLPSCAAAPPRPVQRRQKSAGTGTVFPAPVEHL